MPINILTKNNKNRTELRFPKLKFSISKPCHNCRPFYTVLYQIILNIWFLYLFLNFVYPLNPEYYGFSRYYLGSMWNHIPRCHLIEPYLQCRLKTAKLQTVGLNLQTGQDLLSFTNKSGFRWEFNLWIKNRSKNFGNFGSWVADCENYSQRKRKKLWSCRNKSSRKGSI